MPVQRKTRRIDQWDALPAKALEVWPGSNRISLFKRKPLAALAQE